MVCLVRNLGCQAFRSVHAFHRTQGQPIFLIQRRTIAISDLTNRLKVYEKKKLVGYSDEQMYSVVSDVENYGKFLPWCKQSIVNSRKEDFLKGHLVIGFPPLTESYTSNVTLQKPGFIRAECVDGRLFSHFLTTWRFNKGLKDIPQSCVIDINVAFEFKSIIHSNLAHIFFDQIVKQMEEAFITEAGNRYGIPSLKSHVLSQKSS